MRRSPVIWRLITTTFFRPHLAAVLVAVSATAIIGGMAGSANAATDGIQRLIAVTAVKASNANDAALRQAAAQRALVSRQQQARTSVTPAPKAQSDVQKAGHDTSNAIIKHLAG